MDDTSAILLGIAKSGALILWAIGWTRLGSMLVFEVVRGIGRNQPGFREWMQTFGSRQILVVGLIVLCQVIVICLPTAYLLMALYGI